MQDEIEAIEVTITVIAVKNNSILHCTKYQGLIYTPQYLNMSIRQESPTLYFST